MPAYERQQASASAFSMQSSASTSHKAVSKGLIAGVSAGGVILVIVILMPFVWLRRRGRRTEASHKNPAAAIVFVDKANDFDADADALSKRAMEDAKGDDSNPPHHPFPVYPSYGAEYSTYVHSTTIPTPMPNGLFSPEIQSD